MSGDDTDARLDAHIAYCQKRFEMGEAQFDTLARQQKNTLTALDVLTSSVQQLTANTDKIVAAYNSVEGAVTVGVAVQKFAIWLLKWGVIGAAAYGALRWLLGLPPPP